MFCPYSLVGVDLGVRAATDLRLARPTGRGCTCALFLCELFRVDYIFGAADNVLVYTTLLIISVRRPVFLERFRITIEYTKKRHDCIIDFHVKVIFNT